MSDNVKHALDLIDSPDMAADVSESIAEYGLLLDENQVLLVLRDAAHRARRIVADA